MSLIDDALKRAQAAQGEPGRPAGPPNSPMPLPDSGRTRRRRTTQILLLAAIAIGVLAGLYALLRPRAAEVASERAATETPPAATPYAGTVIEGAPPSGKPASEPGREAARIPPDIVEVVVPPPVRAEGSALPPSAAPDAPPPARVPEAPMPRELPAIARVDPPSLMVASGSPAIVRSEEPRVAGGRPPAVVRGRNYVREVALPSGGRLSLDGIVYSEENPAAVINGRVVRTGSFIEGFEVVRIRSDRVELRDEETTLVILLK